MSYRLNTHVKPLIWVEAGKLSTPPLHCERSVFTGRLQAIASRLQAIVARLTMLLVSNQSMAQEPTLKMPLTYDSPPQ